MEKQYKKGMKFIMWTLDDIDNGVLFVKCLNTVEDDEGVYCIKGKEYPVLDIEDDCFIIEGEDYFQVQIKQNDKDFEIVISEE